MRYLAIDHGNKRTGLAICDKTEMLASPLTVLQLPPQQLIKKIVDIVQAEDIDAIIIGLPLNMDDTQGPQAKIVHKFAQQLQKSIEIPTHFQDERLSSFAAKEKLADTQFTRAKKAKRLDAIAAAEILQTFLEQKKTTQQ